MRILELKAQAKSILESQQVECSFIEYKKSLNHKGSMIKTLCAYANNYMKEETGFLFIGIEEIHDNDHQKAIPKRPIEGIDASRLEILENECRALLAHVHPKPKYHLFSDELDKRSYLVIAVEPGSQGPYRSSDKAEKDPTIKLKAGRYIRVGRETKLPNATEEFELLKKFAGFSFTSSLHESASLDDLNYEYMKEYLLLTGAKEDIRRMSKGEMAKTMGLIVEEGYSRPRVKNSALLMFSDKPSDHIPYAHVEIIREINHTDKMESKRFHGPIWIQVKRVVEYFKDSIHRTYTIRDDKNIEHRLISNYPIVAFEELLTNAVLHKEYDTPEAVGVYIYKDRISFINHNRPLPPVTIKALNNDRSFDKRQYLNKDIKEMFYALNLIESYGSGIRRAKDALSAGGNPPLRFYPDNEVDNYTNAVMEIHEEFLKELDPSEKSVRTSLLEILEHHPDLSPQDLKREIEALSYDASMKAMVLQELKTLYDKDEHDKKPR